MPAKSEKQRKLMAAASECKKKGTCKGKLKDVAEGMSQEQLHDFMRKKKK